MCRRGWWGLNFGGEAEKFWWSAEGLGLFMFKPGCRIVIVWWWQREEMAAIVRFTRFFGFIEGCFH